MLRAKQRVTVAIQFLEWLEQRDVDLPGCTQHDLVTSFGNGPTTRWHSTPFINWSRNNASCAASPFRHARSEPAPPSAPARTATTLRLVDDDWIELPEPIATLLRNHLEDGWNTRTAANAGTNWLFPGGMPASPPATTPGSNLSAKPHQQSSPKPSASAPEPPCTTPPGPERTTRPTPPAGRAKSRTDHQTHRLQQLRFRLFR
jgi:hypothetical protein